MIAAVTPQAGDERRDRRLHTGVLPSAAQVCLPPPGRRDTGPIHRREHEIGSQSGAHHNHLIHVNTVYRPRDGSRSRHRI
jgi:hypothetical protein